MTEFTGVQMPALEYQCEIHVRNRFIGTRECGKPATHIVVAYHDAKGCDPTGMSWAVCEEHSMEQALALGLRLASLHNVLTSSIGAVCGWCDKPLETPDEAGSFNCIHD